jgi:hypothetical protein
MSLQSDVRSYKLSPTQLKVTSALAWEKLRADSTSAVLQYQPSTWVKLFNPPTAYSFDQAWLLCQCSENQWLAWVPEYGELLLNTDEFCSVS